jgi:hypothetical protein
MATPMSRALRCLLAHTLLVAGCNEPATQQPEPATRQPEPAEQAQPAEQVEPAKATGRYVVEPPDLDAARPRLAKQAEPAAIPSDPTVAPTEPILAVLTGACDERQARISKEADERAKPYGIVQHLARSFPDLKVSWLMKETPYQNFVVKTGAERFGRCDDTGCYLFAAPAPVISAAVEQSMKGDTHDAAALGRALGLPAKNFEGPLRMMTLDLRTAGSCVRLPVDSDPGVWKCKSEDDEDCFKFGGYTSGNVPEVMIIDAPVARAVVEEIP